MSARVKWAGMLAMIALVIVLDQFSKYWLLHHWHMASSTPIHVTDFFSIVMVWNYGISFGLFSMPESMMPQILIMLSVLISGVLLRIGMRSPNAHERLAYGIIIGGALGNVIDRIRFGAVADFFYFHIGEIGWPAFNIADAAIFLGVAYLILHHIFNPRGA
jgi:signal peptidase II